MKLTCSKQSAFADGAVAGTQTPHAHAGLGAENKSAVARYLPLLLAPIVRSAADTHLEPRLGRALGHVTVQRIWARFDWMAANLSSVKCRHVHLATDLAMLRTSKQLRGSANGPFIPCATVISRDRHASTDRFDRLKATTSR